MAIWPIFFGGNNNEQHRQATEAVRGSTPPAYPPGNPGAQACSPGASIPPGAFQTSSNALSQHQHQIMAMSALAQAQLSAQFTKALLRGPIQGTAAQCIPTPLEKCPPKVEELIGYRIWSLRRGLLRSVSTSHMWIPGQYAADISLDGERVSADNTAGVWSYKTIEDLHHDYGTTIAMIGPEYHATVVSGTVWLWGTIIEYERGYRAQYAAIRSLDTGRELDRLRALYIKGGTDVDGHDHG